MYKTLKGIVLKKTRFSDSSAYITVISEEGIVTFSAKGIFSPKNRNAPATALYTYSEFVLSCHGENATLSSACIIRALIRQGVDFESLALANYVSTLAHDVTFTEEDSPAIFKLLGTALAIINKMEVPCRIVKAVFELRLMAHLGFYPDLDACSRCGKDFKGGYFLPLEGNVICSECEVFSEKKKIPLPHSVSDALRHLLSVSDTAAFGIRFGDEKTELDFVSLAEDFSVNHLDCALGALNYYKTNLKNLTDLK